MNSKKLKPQQLCNEAETQPVSSAEVGVASCDNAELLHELQVQQIELEMQNEKLRHTQQALERMRDNYIDLYEFSPVAYLIISEQGLIEKANLTAAKLLGIERHNLLQRQFANFINPIDANRWHVFFTQSLKQIEQQTTEFTLTVSKGSLCYVQLACLPYLNVNGHPSLRITLADITERKQNEAELRIAAIAFESHQQGMFITDTNSVILRVNKAFTDITGYTPEEVLGRTPSIRQSDRHDEKFYADMWQSINQTNTWSGEIWNRRKNGEIYPEYLTVTAVKNKHGVFTHYVASFMDITLSKAASDEIKYLAFYDPLTGLANRRLLWDRLKPALASSQRTGKNAALLFIDLDNFKNINDTLGHDMGDLLLQQVAQRLTSCVREEDSVARLGGDEFVVMLEELSEQMFEAAAQTEIIGNKILNALNQSYQLGLHTYQCSSSIGATMFNNQAQSADDLLRQADIAMYQAKLSGRNSLRFFDPKMQACIDARTKLEAELRQALQQNQFKLYYQVQTNNNMEVTGAEVLIRWLHPQRGLIYPVDFIPLAEETGLILPIGQWALETACAQLKLWENNLSTRNLKLAVNVSAKQFHQTDFVDLVCQTLINHNIQPLQLKLELTESLVLDNVADTITKMNILRKLGVHFSMDDFGTGYSSLSYLTRLPLDQLKIDQSFIHNIGIKPSDAVIVQTIIGMAKNLGMEVIAEGVETEAQRHFLEQHGCLFCQGFLFSKAVPIEQFEILIKQLNHIRQAKN